ncbi:MAG: RsmD family RNA methyltransferase [Planctomycetaceae bacterium]
MRIIAGKYRRRKLLTKPGLTTRPITDRAKEPLFERLESHLEGARVADVFAGTGTLGLESLSRGARSVVFIEQDRQAGELLQKNVDAIGVTDVCLCWRADAMRCSFRPKGVPDFVPFDVIFFDPPYRLIEALQPPSPLFKALERLGRSTVSATDAMLCLRAPAESTFTVPSVWQPERSLSIGGMDIHLYQLDRPPDEHGDVSHIAEPLPDETSSA